MKEFFFPSATQENSHRRDEIFLKGRTATQLSNLSSGKLATTELPGFIMGNFFL